MGTYLYAISFVAPIVIPFDMQLRSFYITEKSDKLDFHDYRGFRLASNIIAICIVAVLALLWKPEMFITIMLVGISKVIESQADIYYGAVQKVERMDYISYSRFAKGFGSLIIVFICIRLGMEVDAVLSIWCLYMLLIVVIFDSQRTLRISKIEKRGSNPLFRKEAFIRIFKICLPVLLLGVVDNYCANYPNYVIERNLGLSTLAIFGAVVYFRSVGAQTLNPMGAVVAPRLTSYLQQKRYKDFTGLLKRSTLTAFGLGVVGILVAVFLGKWILTIFYTSEYAAYNNLLIMVMVYCLITYMYIFLGTAITCLRVHWVKLPIHICSFLVLAGLLWWHAEQLTIYTVMADIIIAESVTFLLYTLSFLVLFNKMRSNEDNSVAVFKDVS